MGAKVVDKIKVIRGAGSFITHNFIRLAIYTPNMMGNIFLICFPFAENPTIVKIEPIIGPFKSPPTASTNKVETTPFIAILKNIV